MNKHLTLIAWTTLAAACLSWGGVWYLTSALTEEAELRASATAEALQKADRAAYNQRLLSIANETSVERERLDAVAGLDIVSIVTAIEEAGTAAGVAVEISNASPGDTIDLAGGASLSTYRLVAGGQGTFAELMRVAALLEQLPLISEVETLEFQYLSDSGSSSWRITARLKVLSTEQNI